MDQVKETRKKLVEFIACDKFKVYGHLQPAVESSTEEDKEFVNEEMNLCAKQLSEYLEQGNTSAGEMKNIVKSL